MSVAISTLLPRIRVEAPGVPEPLLSGVTYASVRKFFWTSEAWKYTYDNALDWTANTLAVPSPTAGTDIPAKTVVKRVDQIKYSSSGANWNDVIDFKTRDELDRLLPDWRTRTGSSPLYWSHDNNGQAVITPQTPSTVSSALLIRAVIAPVFTALTDTLPDFLYYEFEETIQAGILVELLKMPGRDWSNPELAALYGGVYGTGVAEARSRAQADYGQPSQVMTYGGI